MGNIDDAQNYYAIKPLYVYVDTNIQSPVDPNGFVRHKYGDTDRPIQRETTQLKTFMSIVKKYRPIVMPNVRDIFNDCMNDKSKYDVDKDNDYGVFGWSTIPSKVMVNMQYNEQSIVVPSSYDHHNRIGGNNFLQMDTDLAKVYRQWNSTTNKIQSNVSSSWYYLYDTRDWTYFLFPFFKIKPNNDVFTWQNETFVTGKPTSSDHLNGVIFEPTTIGMERDSSFGDISSACKFLAKHHHNEKNLRILAEHYTKLIPYEKLIEFTKKDANFNAVYGSSYPGLPEKFRFPD